MTDASIPSAPIYVVTLEDLAADGGQSLRLRRLLPLLAQRACLVLVGRDGPLPSEFDGVFQSRISLPLPAGSQRLSALRGWRGPWRLMRIRNALKQLPARDATIYTDSALIAALLPRPEDAGARPHLVIEVNGIMVAEYAQAAARAKRDIMREVYAPPAANLPRSMINAPSFRAQRMAQVVSVMERRGLRAADQLIAVSEDVAAAVARIICGFAYDQHNLNAEQTKAAAAARARIAIVGNGVDLTRFNPTTNGSAVREAQGWGSAPVGIMISSFRPWHGAQNLIDAMPAILQSRPDFKLVLPGDGPERLNVMTYAKYLHVDAAVEFPGAVAPYAIPQWLAAADIALYFPEALGGADMFLGDPTKLVEYMAMGKPIVAARRGQLTAELERSQCGLAANPEPLAFAAAVVQLLSDSPRAKAMGVRGAEHAARLRSWPSIAIQIAEILNTESPTSN